MRGLTETKVREKNNLKSLFQDKFANKDWNMCLEENSITLGQCVYGCNGNDHCEEDCLYRTGSNPLKNRPLALNDPTSSASCMDLSVRIHKKIQNEPTRVSM